MEALGLDLTWFLFQLGNFIVLMLGLTWLLHRPLLKLLDERKEEIARGLKDAEEAKRQLETAQERQEQLLEEARRESAALLKKAKRQADDLARQAKKEADEHAERLRKGAEEQVAAEADHHRNELKKELAGMVATATSKVLAETSKKDL